MSSVKHLWPAGSHRHRLCDIKCVRTVSSADMRFYKHQVKQPHLCKPTNHPPPRVCLCRPNVIYSPALPQFVFTQIRQFLELEKGGESWPRACYVCQVCQEGLDYTAAADINTWSIETGNRQSANYCKLADNSARVSSINTLTVD